MSRAASDAVLQGQLRQLRMPALAREHEAMVRRARSESWPYEDYLRELLQVEINSRLEHAMRNRIREARLPEVKTLDQLDWEALRGVTRQKVLELASGEWIDKHQNLVLAGPVGTGKTHLAIALAVEATRKLFHVAFWRAADLVRELTEARDERVLGRLHARLARAQLLVLDELGFVPFDRAGGELLFNLLSDRHGSRSTAITTNLAFGEWVQVFGDEKLTTALLDRLTSGAHVLTTKGSSYRARQRPK